MEAVPRAPAPPPAAEGHVRLADGRCRYRVDGPAAGAVVLLLHGATVPAWEFDRLVPYLTAAGLRTLRCDLFGHGDSDRPRVDYDHGLFVRQATGLLDALGVDRPVHVLGHSLGAAVAARLACASPERVDRLVLAAPLVDFASNLPLLRLLRVPGVGEALMPLVVLPLLVRRRTRRYRPIEDGRFVGAFRRQLERPGFGAALLSLVRCGTLGDQRELYRALADEVEHPVLILRGSDDTIVRAEQVAELCGLVPRAAAREVEGVPHAFLLTHPERVAPEIVAFLEGGAA